MIASRLPCVLIPLLSVGPALADEPERPASLQSSWDRAAPIGSAVRVTRTIARTAAWPRTVVWVERRLDETRTLRRYEQYTEAGEQRAADGLEVVVERGGFRPADDARPLPEALRRFLAWELVGDGACRYYDLRRLRSPGLLPALRGASTWDFDPAPLLATPLPFTVHELAEASAAGEGSLLEPDGEARLHVRLEGSVRLRSVGPEPCEGSLRVVAELDLRADGREERRVELRGTWRWARVQGVPYEYDDREVREPLRDGPR